MDNTELYNRIATIVAVLNNIEVKGRQNLDNLSGSIRLLEEVAATLQQAQQKMETTPS